MKRLFWSVVLVFIISVFIFSLIHLLPGDPVTIMLGSFSVPLETISAVRDQLHLNEPIVVQYFLWLKGFLTGNLGSSIVSKKPISELILKKLPISITLAFFGIVIASIISFLLGTLAAYKRNSFIDFFTMGFAVVGVSIPGFWLGLILILIFAANLGILPTLGYVPFSESPIEYFRHLILPAITVGSITMGYLTRLTRSQMIEVLGQDYIRTAKAKGLKDAVILYSHGYKNAMLPIMTAIGARFAALVGGTVLVEEVFAIPGIGRLVLSSVINRDYPVVQAVILVIAIIFIAVNLIIDVLYVIIDPRVKIS